MLVEIGEFYYSLPDSWSDLTLSDFIELNNAAQDPPKEDATEAEKFEFYIKYISHFGIPEEHLRNIKLYDATDEQMGVVNLFNHLWQFTQMNEGKDVDDFKRFYLGNDIYCFNTNSIDLTGAEKPMADYTFQEYEEANGVLQAMNKVSEGKLEMLAYLCAIFYRPAIKKPLQWFRSYEIEAYNEDDVKERAELFTEQLTMNKVWKCYFFLLNQMIKSNRNTASSLLEEVEKNLS